jgi:hypothetical protein
LVGQPGGYVLVRDYAVGDLAQVWPCLICLKTLLTQSQTPLCYRRLK